MAKKKSDIMKEALISAKAIEEAALENAKDLVVESFSDKLSNIVAGKIDEEVGPGLPDSVSTKKDPATDPNEDEIETEIDYEDADVTTESEEEDMDYDEDEEVIDEECGDEHEEDMEEATDHDVGKDSSPARDEGTDDTDTELSEADDEEIDLDIEDDDEEITEGDDEDDDNDVEINIDNDDDDDDESDDDDDDDESDEKSDDDESDDDGEVDIPDELFDDEPDDESKDDKKEDDDEEVDEVENLNLDVDDEDDVFEEEEEIDLDIEDDEEEVEESVMKRIAKLTSENKKLKRVVNSMRVQLEEVNLFNAKITSLNKLSATGLYTKDEKYKIADKLDECTTVKSVIKTAKKLYDDIVNANPLDEVHQRLTENNRRMSTKPVGESVFESEETKRLKKMAGIE